MNDIWSGLADFLARMIEKYGDSLGIDDFPTIEFLYYADMKSQALKKYYELIRIMKPRSS